MSSFDIIFSCFAVQWLQRCHAGLSRLHLQLKKELTVRLKARQWYLYFVSGAERHGRFEEELLQQNIFSRFVLDEWRLTDAVQRWLDGEQQLCVIDSNAKQE